MDDCELIDELLELTLACQQQGATAEERARLERLLADNPQAILPYLQITDDTLTLIDAATAKESASIAPRVRVGDLPVTEPTASPSKAFIPLMFNHQRGWLVAMAIAGMLMAAFLGQRLWRRPTPNSEGLESLAETQAARIVGVSNVRWSQGAKHFDEWAWVNPGDSLTIESGWINLFLSGGAELLIEGPADVRYVSPQCVYARQGKLAARIGPGAIGFHIDTPHANVIDRGTSFGVSVASDSHTSVVVYEGIVDLDVVGDRSQPRRRLATGEALCVDGSGHLSRITTVQSAEFLEPPQIHQSEVQHEGIITNVTDNIRSLETAKYYRVIPRGFREDSRAYVDRLHEWNGLDERGLPPFLVDGDYVMTFNDDKVVSEIEIAVTVSQPANLFVLIDDRVPPPEWLKRDFVDTTWDVGSDEGWEDRIIDVASGPGHSVEHVFSVWRRVVPQPTTVLLGAISYETPPPAVDVGRSMYGIVVTPHNLESVQPLN